MAKKKEQPKNRTGIIIGICAVLFFFTLMFAGIVSILLPGEGIQTGNVAVIPIKGIIVSEGDGAFGEDVTKSTVVAEQLEEIAKDSSIKAIILDINSPGGSAVASEEIANALKELDKPVVSYIRDVGASGAYWVAASSDQIFASRMSITGSVGVISSYLEVDGFLNDWNITHRRLVAGKYKDIGSPLKEMTQEEQEIFQGSIDAIHDIFLDDVITQRGLTKSAAQEVQTARFFIGIEAKEIGLIDEFGGKKQAIAYVEDLLEEEVELITYQEEVGFLDLLAQSISKAMFSVGQGIGTNMQITT